MVESPRNPIGSRMEQRQTQKPEMEAVISEMAGRLNIDRRASPEKWIEALEAYETYEQGQQHANAFDGLPHGYAEAFTGFIEKLKLDVERKRTIDSEAKPEKAPELTQDERVALANHLNFLIRKYVPLMETNVSAEFDYDGFVNVIGLVKQSPMFIESQARIEDGASPEATIALQKLEKRSR